MALDLLTDKGHDCGGSGISLSAQVGWLKKAGVAGVLFRNEKLPACVCHVFSREVDDGETRSND